MVDTGWSEGRTRHTSLVGDTAPRSAGYPRISKSRRFRVLHETAEAVLDELTECFVVDRREGMEPAGIEPGAPMVRTVRLVPRCPAAGPLAIAFTDFPGVVLRLGRWFVEPLPGRGCDDCAEDPAGVVGGLRDRGAAHIEGGLWGAYAAV